MQVNKIVGGHRATILAKVAAVKSGARYAQEDGSTAPATHPITNGGAS